MIQKEFWFQTENVYHGAGKRDRLFMPNVN